MGKNSIQIYDAEKLAKFFGVSVKTAREWCQSGKVPAFKIGKEWKIRVEDLQKLINGKIKAQRIRPPRGGMF